MLEELKKLEALQAIDSQIFSLEEELDTLPDQNDSLESEIKDMKFTRKYLTGEEAGRRFAESLLGGA